MLSESLNLDEIISVNFFLLKQHLSLIVLVIFHHR